MNVEIIREFNNFFQGSEKVVVNKNRIEITIGSQTMLISLPKVIGVQSNGSS